MKGKYTIGVIMATHNGKNTILNAINSIVEQSIKNWKFVICDDASTDKTYELLIEKYKDDERFILIKNESNLGLAASLNKCIELCQDTEYIARMDDDDISYPNRFKVQIDFLEKNNQISFVSSSVDLYNGKKIIGRRILKEYPRKKDLIYTSPFTHPATMFRKEDLLEVGCYRVSAETKRGQDYDLFMRMYGKGFLGANLQEPVFRYTENISTIKKRSLKTRIGEFKIRVRGYKEMKIFWYAFPFALKPFIAHIRDILKIKGEKR